MTLTLITHDKNSLAICELPSSKRLIQGKQQIIFSKEASDEEA